ncbi:GWT1-domain-containing protein [Hymenopellis radicata]|nr:GWT1-domain-containing protein [Hymenopellis radicata]
MSSDYKKQKEDFVSGMTGSTVTHINLISCAALISIYLYNTVQARFPTGKTLPVSWLVLVVPLLLSMTVFANAPALLDFLLTIPVVALLYLPRKDSSTPLPSRAETPVQDESSIQVVTPLPALTTYRAHMMLMTILAILAVDFPVFPRNLAKCESFGVSLMDIGVGSFVFSQGVVSAISLLKNPAYLTSPFLPKLISMTKKVLPILALGLLRVVLVKGTEYPEHESEYGTHWNFFITMALLPILELLLHPIILRVPLSLLAVLISLTQQLNLSVFGFQLFALTAERVGIFSANKEGIISLPGYLAIHIFGLSTGTLILPPSPSYFRRFQRRFSETGSFGLGEQRSYKRRKNAKAAMELFSYTVLWWTCMGLVRGLQIDGKEGVSRRVVNLSYVMWIAAFNTSFILGYLLLDMHFYPEPSKFKKRDVDNSDAVATYKAPVAPSLLDAINKNALVIFLLCNVMTGIINLTMSTMFASNVSATLVLCVYSFSICAVAWAFRRTRLLTF